MKDAPDDETMWFHDDGQYGLLVGGKAHSSMGELYHIDIPETRYMAGARGLFLYTGTGFMPFHVSFFYEHFDTMTCSLASSE